MATATRGTVMLASARDRVVDAVGEAAHLGHEARVLKTLAADAIEDGVHSAKRAIRRGAHEIEDLRDTAVSRVRRAPLASIALAGGAGLLLGIVVGWLGYCAAQPARTRTRTSADHGVA